MTPRTTVTNKIDIQSLVQHTSSDGFRIYRDGRDIDYISCTTLLGMYEDKTALLAWQERLGQEEAEFQCKVAADRGTAAHLEIEQYLEKSLLIPDYQPPAFQSKFATNALRGFYDSVTAIEMESMVAYYDATVGGFAGQFDSLVQMHGNSFMCDGEILPEMVVISDLKTKKKSQTVRQDFIYKHLLQLSAYVVAKELQSGIKIDGAVIVFAYPRSCKTYFLSRYKINHYWSMYQSLLRDYYNILPLQKTWKYMIAQSEYCWNEDYGDFENFAPVLMTKILK